MPQKLAFKPSSKFIVTVAIALSVTIMGSAAVLWYLGSYTKPELRKGVSEPYTMAYILNVGPYDKIHATFEEVAEHLRKANIEPKTPCVLLMDGSKVNEGQRRSKVGYLISRHDYVPAPLDSETLPQRDVLIATFEGGAMMGSYKSYEAMRDWVKRYDYSLSLPAFEIYHPNGIMEYQLGVSKNSAK